MPNPNDLPAVSFLAGCTKETLQTLKLDALNEAAELRRERKEIMGKIDEQIIRCEKLAEIVGWLCDKRDELWDSLRIDTLQKSFKFGGDSLAKPTPVTRLNNRVPPDAAHAA